MSGGEEPTSSILDEILRHGRSRATIAIERRRAILDKTHVNSTERTFLPRVEILKPGNDIATVGQSCANGYP